jgi:hypothetical protein
MRLWEDAYTISYSLVEAGDTLPFKHEYAGDLFLSGRDVLGTGKVALEYADTLISQQDAIAVLTYYAELDSEGVLPFDKKDNYFKETVTENLTENANKALTFAYENGISAEADGSLAPDKLFTMADMAAVLGKLNAISGIFWKYEVAASDKEYDYKKTKTPSLFNFAELPANRDFYQSIMAEVPVKVYTEGVTYTNEKNPKRTFANARVFSPNITEILRAAANNAKKNGVEVKFTYYPTLAYDKENRNFILTLKCEILSAKDGAKLSDVASTNIDKSLTAGTEFFIDYHHNIIVAYLPKDEYEHPPVDKATIERVVNTQ